MTIRRSLLAIAAIVAMAVTSCGSSTDTPNVGTSSEPLSFKSAPSEFDWTRFPDGMQCIGAVSRYFNTVHGAAIGNMPNTDDGACCGFGACHAWLDDTPDSTKFNRHPWGTTTPQAEDIVIFPPQSGDCYGHAAVVDHVDSAGNLFIMDNNWNLDSRKANCTFLDKTCGHVHTAWYGGKVWTPYGLYRLKSKEPAPPPTTTWSTVRGKTTPDLNGDGKDDICGRASGGIYCALSNGASFGATSYWTTTQFTDAGGWKSDPSFWGTIQYPDVNGDGMADVCGRSSIGIACALSNGNAFDEDTYWSSSFSNAGTWNTDPSYWMTIQYPDVNGDGRADICARASGGIYCALSNGKTFDAPTYWTTPNYSDANGWKADPSYWGTIQFPDLNHDGKADVCGRGAGGIFCALSNGKSFGAPSYWSTTFSDASGWKSDPSYWATIEYPDVNGDGKADVCGRSSIGFECALSNGSAFGATSLWSAGFTNTDGWKADPSYWRTIQFADVDGDGKSDVCGRGGNGISCALSSGAAFGTATYWTTAMYTDGDGWKADPSYWETIQFPNVDGVGGADVCGRGSDGIHCAVSHASSFGAPTTWTSSYTDAGGWKADPSYWQTIHFP